jgi:hypothetical protein
MPRIFEMAFDRRSEISRVVLQSAHGRSNLALEVVFAGDRHAADGVCFQMFPDKFVWIAVVEYVVRKNSRNLPPKVSTIAFAFFARCAWP